MKQLRLQEAMAQWSLPPLEWGEEKVAIGLIMHGTGHWESWSWPLSRRSYLVNASITRICSNSVMILVPGDLWKINISWRPEAAAFVSEKLVAEAFLPTRYVFTSAFWLPSKDLLLAGTNRKLVNSRELKLAESQSHKVDCRRHNFKITFKWKKKTVSNQIYQLKQWTLKFKKSSFPPWIKI